MTPKTPPIVNLSAEIDRQNPWFNNPKAMAEDPSRPKRAIYPLLFERVTNRSLITAVVGLRRVGKTTLLKQVINQLLLAGQERGRLLYLSFEDFGYLQTTDALVAVIEAQLTRFPQSQLYFFFDEIQYVNGWNGVLKKYFDLSPRLKFVISGSSSLFIATSIQESLAGRLQEIKVYPMGFGEYLSIHHGLEIPLTSLFETENLISQTTFLREKLPEYLSFGEFPYLPFLPGWEEKREYLLDFVIGKVVEHDLPRLRRILGPAELKNLADVLFINAGGIIQMQNLGSDIGLSLQTLREYLGLLEKACLFSQIYNKGIGFRQRSLRQRKIYSTSTNALVFKLSSGPMSESFNLHLGQIIENYVFNYLSRTSLGEIFFFRQRQIKEVDFIVSLPDKILPVEVKYQANLKPSDYKSLIYYCHREKLSEAVIITKDTHQTLKLDNISLRLIPAYFLV